MRFALYHPWTYLRGGIERMIAEYLSRTRHDWTLYTHYHQPETTFEELRTFDVVELRPRVTVRRTLPHLVRAAATIASCKLPSDGSRGLLISSEGLGDLLLTRNRRLPAVVYCHTPLKIWHDPVTRKALRARDRGKARALEMIGPAFDLVDRRLWRRYRHVFVNGLEIRARVEQARLASPDRIEILYPGVDAERFSFSPGPRDNYLLVAGRLVFGKNIELAVDAFARAHQAGLKGRLVIAGIVDEKSRSYLEALRARASGVPITFETDPSEQDFVRLLQRCLALVFPSWNEEFGMVPLEAMATGTPVLAVDAGGPRETIVAGETGWLVPPTSEAFAETMRWIEDAGDALEPMRKAARARALEFSWDRFAQRLDDVMELNALEAAERLERAP